MDNMDNNYIIYSYYIYTVYDYSIKNNGKIMGK